MSVELVAVMVGAAILLGSATQRLTGMGFALVSAPALVVMVGATNGVSLLQVLGFIVSLTVLVSTFRDVAWRKAVALAVPAAIGILPGWWVARTIPGPILLITIGCLVVLAIVAMLADERFRVFRGLPGLFGAGFLSGFMNVIAGVGGPTIALYKLSTNWDQREFLATVQVYFMSINVGAVLALGWPQIDQVVWAGALGGLVVGIVLGHLLVKRVPVEVASRLVVLVALGGAVVTLVQGLLQLLS